MRQAVVVTRRHHSDRLGARAVVRGHRGHRGCDGLVLQARNQVVELGSAQGEYAGVARHVRTGVHVDGEIEGHAVVAAAEVECSDADQRRVEAARQRVAAGQHGRRNRHSEERRESFSGFGWGAASVHAEHAVEHGGGMARACRLGEGVSDQLVVRPHRRHDGQRRDERRLRHNGPRAGRAADAADADEVVIHIEERVPRAGDAAVAADLGPAARGDVVLPQITEGLRTGREAAVDEDRRPVRGRARGVQIAFCRVVSAEGCRAVVGREDRVPRLQVAGLHRSGSGVLLPGDFVPHALVHIEDVHVGAERVRRAAALRLLRRRCVRLGALRLDAAPAENKRAGADRGNGVAESCGGNAATCFDVRPRLVGDGEEMHVAERVAVAVAAADDDEVLRDSHALQVDRRGAVKRPRAGRVPARSKNRLPAARAFVVRDAFADRGRCCAGSSGVSPSRSQPAKQNDAAVDRGRGVV
mmetsp:Transcript_17076/g.53011  ORF Transcript_17076/g.53011 Transcript_17076/m.53011 type:complete len:471 (+) Transcript_17076:1206-2618(+)